MKGWTIFILISINQMKIVPEELWCAADPVRKMDPMPVPMVISTEQPKPIRINLWGSWNEMPSDNVNWFLLAGTLSSREITRFMPNLVRSREINDVQSECLACLLTSERCMHRFKSACKNARTNARTPVCLGAFECNRFFGWFKEKNLAQNRSLTNSGSMNNNNNKRGVRDVFFLIEQHNRGMRPDGLNLCVLKTLNCIFTTFWTLLAN